MRGSVDDDADAQDKKVRDGIRERGGDEADAVAEALSSKSAPEVDMTRLSSSRRCRAAQEAGVVAVAVALEDEDEQKVRTCSPRTASRRNLLTSSATRRCIFIPLARKEQCEIVDAGPSSKRRGSKIVSSDSSAMIRLSS